MKMLTQESKGLVLVIIGTLCLLLNGWITIKVICCVLAIVLINYGLILMRKPSLTDMASMILSQLKFW